jgi:pimeloyl-ACP methyl ester carboxylesterase
MIVAPLLLLFFAQAEVRSVPPPGIPVPAEERAALESGLAKLNAAIQPIARNPRISDVLIFREAVRVALQYNEFFKPEEFAKARRLLDAGLSRAEALRKGEAPWASQTGLVVRGYVSNIDDSVQPYGLVVPPSWSPNSRGKWRLDIWFHGRGDTLSEVNFIDERMRRPGEFTPRDTIVLHLYGRYCNANKFAGEVDLFEALADVKKHYAIDEDRILVRGFSMGGAATWHIAAHHAGLWAAAAPGAGFAETAEYQKWDPADFTEWERRLWRMYDATAYALNFFNLPLVAYSGEIDRQKQAADIMARYLAKEGMQLAHIIGPNTEHKYHPDSKVEIERRIDAIAARGRDANPEEIRFTTSTLRYNRMKWLIVDGLQEHWLPARIIAKRSAKSGRVEIETSNVTALSLTFVAPNVVIDGVSIPSNQSAFHKDANGVWRAGAMRGPAGTLRKLHGLQGPIDDAFMSRFIMVAPTAGEPSDRVKSEMARATREWRKMFRGEAIQKKDTEITDADVAGANLILWGDPGSNALLAKIVSKIPAFQEWTASTLVFRGQKYDPGTHMPVLIFPNPLNPAKYVVINSGMTFREADYLTNSRQIPKLPDWAIVDTTVPADARRPGRIVTAGFFNEAWQ